VVIDLSAKSVPPHRNCEACERPSDVVNWDHNILGSISTVHAGSIRVDSPWGLSLTIKLTLSADEARWKSMTTRSGEL
jgi:hypothetical protein